MAGPNTHTGREDEDEEAKGTEADEAKDNGEGQAGANTEVSETEGEGAAEGADETPTEVVEGTRDKLESNFDGVTEAVRGNELLKVLFEESNENAQLKKLQKLGYAIQGIGGLRKTVKACLEVFGQPSEKIKGGKILKVATLLAYGIKTASQVADLLNALIDALPKTEKKERRKEEEKEEKVVEEKVETPAAPEAPEPEPEAEKPAKETTETPKELASQLHEKLKDNQDFEDMYWMIRLLKTKPEAVPTDQQAGYKAVLQKCFGTDDIEPVREALKATRDSALINFIDTSLTLGEDGVLDQIYLLEQLLGELSPNERTVEMVTMAVQVLARSLRELKIAPKPAPEPAKAPDAPTEPVAEPVADVAKPAEEKKETIMISSDVKKALEIITSEGKAEPAVLEKALGTGYGRVALELQRLGVLGEWRGHDYRVYVDRLEAVLSEATVEPETIPASTPTETGEAIPVSPEMKSVLQVIKTKNKAGVALCVAALKWDYGKMAGIFEELQKRGVLGAKNSQTNLYDINQAKLDELLSGAEAVVAEPATVLISETNRKREELASRLHEALKDNDDYKTMIQFLGRLRSLKFAFQTIQEDKTSPEAVFIADMLKRLPAGELNGLQVLSFIVGELDESNRNEEDIRDMVNRLATKLRSVKTETEGADAATEETKVKAKRLQKELMSNSDMEELVHMLRLLKTNPSGLPRDLKKEYQNALIEYFGTENINDIVDKLNKDGKSAEAVFIREFLEKGPSGEPDERKILEYILAEGVYPENQTDDEVKEVLHMLVEKLGSYKGNLPNKEARKEAAEAAKKAEKAEKEATAERQKMVDAFLKRMSQDTEKKSPVVIAVQRLLMEKKVTEEGLKTLEIYLKGGKRLDDLEADEIDEFIAGRSVQELKKVLKATENQTENLEDELADAESKTQKKDRREVEKMRTLKQDMNRLRKEYALFEVMADDDRARLNDAKRNRYLAIGAQLAAMEKEYNELNEADTDPNIILLKRKIRGLKKQKTYLEAGIKRLEGKKTEETQYYVDKPEKLLGNILTYYAEQKMKEEGKKGTPNYDDILKELHKRITEANESQAGWCRKIVMYASPHSYLKPTLKGTLMAVVGKDDALTKVKPEYAAELAKKWRSPRDVRNWISKLEGVQEAEAMKTIVPALIGHLSAAVNIGGNTYLNTFSIVQAKGLLHNLRQAAHQYSMEQAETKTGTGVEKMNAYFGQLNQIHRNADDVKKSTVSQNMYKVLARNAFIVGGMAAGGWQIAPLLGPAAAAIGSIGIPASTLGVAAAPVGLTLAGSFGIKTPAIREFMQRNAVRTLAVGGLGALAFGATPLLAGGLIAGGLFAPNIWRNRGAIASAAGKATTVAAPVVGKAGVKVGKGVGYVAARGASVGAGVFAAGLLGGLPLLSSKYRKFIGLNAGRWDPLNSGPQSAPSPRPTLSPQPA